jgi:hypothetical protein
MVAVALLTLALLRNGGPLKNAAGTRGAGIAGAVLLATGGAFVAYVSVVGLLAVFEVDAVYDLTLTRFFAAESYSSFADLVDEPATPWLALAAFAALLLAVLLQTRATRHPRA